jgi:hypothetical protein
MGRPKCGIQEPPERILPLSKDLGGDPRATARTILNYLKANPAASDDLDGIARFWMPKGQPLEVVRKAASILVSENHLIVETDSTEKKVYRRGV